MFTVPQRNTIHSKSYVLHKERITAQDKSGSTPFYTKDSVASPQACLKANRRICSRTELHFQETTFAWHGPLPQIPIMTTSTGYKSGLCEGLLCHSAERANPGQGDTPVHQLILLQIAMLQQRPNCSSRPPQAPRTSSWFISQSGSHIWTAVKSLS